MCIQEQLPSGSCSFFKTQVIKLIAHLAGFLKPARCGAKKHLAISLPFNQKQMSLSHANLFSVNGLVLMHTPDTII